MDWMLLEVICSEEDAVVREREAFGEVEMSTLDAASSMRLQWCRLHVRRWEEACMTRLPEQLLAVVARIPLWSG